MVVFPTNMDVNIQRLANSAPSNEYFSFRCVTPFKLKKIQPSIDIPLIGSSAQNRFIFRFTGQAQDFSFQFVLFNDAQDVSDGEGIVTVQQQAEYLMDTIFTQEWDTDWQIAIPDQITGTLRGVIDTIDLDTPVGGRIRTGTITFKVGRIGSL